MGGKKGSSQTNVEIPEWLDAAMQEAVGQGLTDFNAFRTKGMEMIMPPEGQTNVNFRNPWDLVPGAPGPVRGGGGGRRTPDDGSSSPTNGGSGGGGGGGRGGTGGRVINRH